MSVGKIEIVAKRYARALFDVTAPADFDRVEARLVCIAGAWSGSAELRAVMQNPQVLPSARMAVVAEILQRAGGCATDPLWRTLEAIIGLRKGATLPALAETFAALVRAYRKSLSLEVVVAKPVNQQEVSELRGRLSQSLGGDVALEVSADPELLGGMTLKVGDRYLDRSVSGTLKRMAAELVR